MQSIREDDPIINTAIERSVCCSGDEIELDHVRNSCASGTIHSSDYQVFHCLTMESVNISVELSSEHVNYADYPIQIMLDHE